MKFKQLSFFLLALVFLQGMLVTQASADAKPEVVFETSKGSFTLELYPDKAPLTVANFLAYVDEGFYDNTIFHRVPYLTLSYRAAAFESGMKYKETREAGKE